MDGAPYLAEIGRQLSAIDLEAVLIGNAAAALQGAPVTTVDFDFMFRKTPRNLRKLKALAKALGAMVMRPYYPASDLYRVVRDDGLQVDFMASIHGIRSFEGLRDRADAIDVGGVTIRVASLRDIKKTKVAQVFRPATDRAGGPKGLRYAGSQTRSGTPRLRKRKLAALARESERDLRELIRRWQALPPGRRTKFLRARVGLRGSAL